ncbi:hypothetical protein FXN61_29845 [Lentzea sp. PSKA42]|uniref:Uncharacterized protein n=1 Tax=Lentzea indica TaxID=2604800 RepID=A0ABX1FP38_9PSEU|nr:hypothetical protein [Lentzea indica]NKE60764.1 hypothetical protein [Lentzea indica]
MTGAVVVSPLFAHLVDDAGLFPPEALTMTEATARHRHDSAAGHPVLTHRFLCTTGDLPAFLDALHPEDRFSVGLITHLDPSAVRSALSRTADDPRVELVGVEGPLPSGPDSLTAVMRALNALDDLPQHASGYIEVPLAGDRPPPVDVLRLLGRGRRAAKVRCGGLRTELFPSCQSLGAFVHACVTEDVPFKATAGLHHAVRYRDERTGFIHHGFLNLLLAVCRVVDGGTGEAAVAVLGSTDAEALAAEARQVSSATAAAARALFVAYGSCSTSEPIDDLRALGLVAKEDAA